MDLKEKLISSFLVFENKVDVEAYVHDVRSKAIKTFEDKGFPTKKDENWKYTSLNRILKENYTLFSKKETALEYRDVKSILSTISIPIRSFLSTVSIRPTCRKRRMMVWIFV